MPLSLRVKRPCCIGCAAPKREQRALQYVGAAVLECEAATAHPTTAHQRPGSSYHGAAKSMRLERPHPCTYIWSTLNGHLGVALSMHSVH
jgi:hypothetical protein